MSRKFMNFTQFVNEKYSYRVTEADETAATDTEGTPGAPTAAAPMVINLSNEFPSGKWKLTPQVSQSINAQLPKIEEYIKAHGNSAITIVIKSGESQVPNKDAEAQPGPDGQLPAMKPGQLATNRANSVKAILDGFLAALKSKGTNTDNIKVEIAPPVIGTTPWKPGNDAADPAYTREQYVNLEIKATGSELGGGNPLKSYATMGESIFDGAKHLFGTLHYKISEDGHGVTKGGPSVLRLANGNTGQYLNKYVEIPAGKDQEYFGTTHTVQSPQIGQQLQAAAKPVPQTDPLYGKTINDAH